MNDLIIKCSPFVYNLCQKWCRPPIESEDITQNALIKISKNLSSFKFDSKFSTWVYSLTYNVFLDEYRKVKRREKIAPQSELQEDAINKNDGTEEDQSELLASVLGMLSEDHKAILLLIDLEELSYVEAAQALNIEVGTVRSRLARARISFKDNLVKYGTINGEKNVISSGKHKDIK